MRPYTNLNDTYARELRHALRQVRGALSSSSRAHTRHGREWSTSQMVAMAMAAIAKAEVALVRAIDTAQDARPARKRRAA